MIVASISKEQILLALVPLSSSSEVFQDSIGGGTPSSGVGPPWIPGCGHFTLMFLHPVTRLLRL